jgi:hypothetical protein
MHVHNPSVVVLLWKVSYEVLPLANKQSTLEAVNHAVKIKIGNPGLLPSLL